MSFSIVNKFEQTIAEFFGAPYAVAVDCCTHGLELCLRLQNIADTSCPKHTYISVPFTLEKLGLNWHFRDQTWQDYYYLGETNIVDAAVLWEQHSYVAGTQMSLSFQFKKHLGLGRGGMILLDHKDDYVKLCKMRYDGREDHAPWVEQDIGTMGYHYYMTPETAQRGLDLFPAASHSIPQRWNNSCYPDLSKMTVFNETAK